MVGKIERVPLRDVWKHEALDFTTWLEDNIDVLNEALGVNLTSAEREKPSGVFSADIVAEDADGHSVVIENQLERSDHDHLGKIITYLSNLEASAAIWIVAEPRPEHVNAVAWLNESYSASFFLVKVEAVRIGDSEPAPLLTLIVGPSEESRDIGQQKKELKERHVIRLRFWEQLLMKAKQVSKLHANRSPTKDPWIAAPTGKRGLHLNYVIRTHAARVELYIDLGKGRDEETVKAYERLLSAKDEIESAFGDSLDWHRLEGKRASRISKTSELGGYKAPEDKWPAIQDAMVDAMVRLEGALRPHIRKLKA